MKNAFLIALVSTLFIAKLIGQPEVRISDPVVMTGLGDLLDKYLPEDIIMYRYMNSSWTNIACQVDERVEMSWVDPYYVDGNLEMICSPNHFNLIDLTLAEQQDIVFYADPKTNVGADKDIVIDDLDEIVFMYDDAGEEQVNPILSYPSGLPSDKVDFVIEVKVEDDINSGYFRYAYIFVGDKLAQYQANNDYVSYTTNPFPLQKTNCESTEETSTIITDEYEYGFSDVWIEDRLVINRTVGVDVLDHHQNFFEPGNCDRTEFTFSQGENAQIANIDGPVRAIKSYMGANSGVFTQRTHKFYEARHDLTTFLRVHPVYTMYDVFDFEPVLQNHTIERNTNGFIDNIGGNGPANQLAARQDWEVIYGPLGSIIMIHNVVTNMNSVQCVQRGYYDDAGGGAAHKGCVNTGDDMSYGTTGVYCDMSAGPVCTDPTHETCEDDTLVFPAILEFERVHYYSDMIRDGNDAEDYYQGVMKPLTYNRGKMEPDMAAGLQVSPASIGIGESTDLTYNISNLGNVLSNGSEILVRIFKTPSAGTLTLDPLPSGWTLSNETSSYFDLTTQNLILPGILNGVAINATFTHSGAEQEGTISMVMRINPGSGGESNSNNNNDSAIIQINK